MLSIASLVPLASSAREQWLGVITVVGLASIILFSGLFFAIALRVNLKWREQERKEEQ